MDWGSNLADMDFDRGAIVEDLICIHFNLQLIRPLNYLTCKNNLYLIHLTNKFKEIQTHDTGNLIFSRHVSVRLTHISPSINIEP